MIRQSDLFLVPSAPRIDATRYEAWPFPGLTAHETAQSVLAQSAAYKSAIAATILSGTADLLTESMVRAAIPQDWQDALGRFCHASLCQREAELHGIRLKHVPHDGGGFHVEYRTGAA